ncbi:hypothetical protein IC757_06865 [Wenzhouxiangella sp. AB-CW3]|uniref:hypothetical protein n=1 Tax=Wenzhouxiangella sp. AB-CW3 TaxID=2771012 RepID=UPI00168B7A04|nr:hypothetical protein [Wenzhouxiangella sp. AB-CW3]QOC23838.1 hypothetical protein IC757_06865 [Wenzhouxiangella sp. AB-CW3]
MKGFRLSVLTTALLVTLPALADPTRPPSPAEIRAWLGTETRTPAEPRWQLQSVMLADERRIAVINGQRVRIGESIDQARVIDISPGQVKLEDSDGQPVTLKIGTRFTAQPDRSGD